MKTISTEEIYNVIQQSNSLEKLQENVKSASEKLKNSFKNTIATLLTLTEEQYQIYKEIFDVYTIMNNQLLLALNDAPRDDNIESAFEWLVSDNDHINKANAYGRDIGELTKKGEALGVPVKLMRDLFSITSHGKFMLVSEGEEI